MEWTNNDKQAGLTGVPSPGAAACLPHLHGRLIAFINFFEAATLQKNVIPAVPQANFRAVCACLRQRKSAKIVSLHAPPCLRSV
jgi:hypothetical protein